MRKLQLLIIYILVDYCFSRSDIDQCTKGFEEVLSTKCESIHSTCGLTNYSPKRCISIKNNGCSNGNGDEYVCKNTVHQEFPIKKCVYNSSSKTCNEEYAKCSDYNLNSHKINGVQLNKEDCSKLKPEEADNDHHCHLDTNGVCTSYYKDCTKIQLTSSSLDTVCTDNIPEKFNEKCELDGDRKCQKTERKCNTHIYNINKEECHKLNPSNNKKKCVYDYDNNGNGYCFEQNILCEDYSTIECPTTLTTLHPLIENGNDFDYRYNCKLVSEGGSQKCDKELRECESYNGDDDTICPSLKLKDSSFKRCIYFPRAGHNICKEEYNKCEYYNNNEIEKSREGCESIIPLNSNEKCVYIPEEDICETKVIYSDCDKYEGNDKKICESIISPNTNSYCILEKDSKCKERPLLCHEAFNEEDCLYIAKASDNNKRCSYGYTSTSTSKFCYEEYIRCEDYLGVKTSECESIKLYDGKKCKFDLDLKKCISEDKICEYANTKEECELIAQTGVSDPDKKICQYDDSTKKCKENYKYCSDFRGSDDGTCENIKPYNETENIIDVTSKCIYEDDVGCQRVPKACSDGDRNPILCALISPKIQDNKLKYCAYINGQCQEHFKTCESFQLPIPSHAFDCAQTIPQNYLKSICHFEYDSTTEQYNCVTSKDCTLFEPADYETLCYQVNHNCEYSTDRNGNPVCVTKEKKCEDIKFYKLSDENEEICESMEASKVYMNCTLKEDKSGCEEVYNKTIYKNTDVNTPPGEDSRFITTGIEIILIMLSLLF